MDLTRQDDFFFKNSLQPEVVEEIPFSGQVISDSITSFLARIPEHYNKLVQRNYLSINGQSVIRVRYAKQMATKSEASLRRLVKSRVTSIRESALYELARRGI